ncbi:MAG: class II aldolase/adducin family protein [bacterium]|nr:class II aldolase/adducin family protein [bacterium]
MRTESEIRSEMVEILSCMWDRGHANTTGVSISERADGDRIIVDQSGTGFRRCKITEDDLLVINTEGDLLEDAPNGSQRRAPANVIIHTEYYKANSLARACVHCHAPYTQVFSCENKDIHPYTLQALLMGVVPCIAVDDRKLKSEFHRKEVSLSVPSGLHNRPDVFYVMREVARGVVKALEPRNDEMKIHGLAATHYQHGIFVFGRSLGEAFDNLERAEANARAILLSSAFKGF